MPKEIIIREKNWKSKLSWEDWLFIGAILGAFVTFLWERIGSTI